VTTPVNTEGGKLSGFEINVQQPFSFLPGVWKNLGVLLNYTQVKSNIDYLVSPTSNAVITDDLVNLSPKSANATLYYDDNTFSARISASRRSGFVTRVPGQNNNNVEGKNSSTNVDISMKHLLSGLALLAGGVAHADALLLVLVREQGGSRPRAAPASCRPTSPRAAQRREWNLKRQTT